MAGGDRWQAIADSRFMPVTMALRVRHFVSKHLCILIAVEFVAALVIVSLNLRLVAFCLAVFTVGMLLFHWMANGGVKRLEWLASEEPSSE